MGWDMERWGRRGQDDRRAGNGHGTGRKGRQGLDGEGTRPRGTAHSQAMLPLLPQDRRGTGQAIGACGGGCKLAAGLNLALSFVVITLCCVNDAKYIMRFPCVPDFVYQGRNQGQNLEQPFAALPGQPSSTGKLSSASILPLTHAISFKVKTLIISPNFNIYTCLFPECQHT